MNDLQVLTHNFLEYSRCQKRLDEKTLKAYLQRSSSCPRYINFHKTVMAVYTFPLITVSLVTTVKVFWFLIIEMLLHFCFHHFFDCPTELVLQGILDILNRPDIILF